MLPWFFLYNNKELINEIADDDTADSGINDTHFMDLKNQNHPFIKDVIRPFHLFSKVQNISYYNGFYWHSTATYDKNNKFILKYAWQYRLIIGSSVSLIGLLLHYVSLKCGLYKLLFLPMNQVDKCLF